MRDITRLATLLLLFSSGWGCGASAPVSTDTDGGGDDAASSPAGSDMASSSPAPKTVFLILMENHNWSDIKGSASAPYINGSLLPMGAHAENYWNPPGIHPSEPNYLWLEAGTNFGVKDDNPPSVNHQSTSLHLTALLEKAGVSWRSYQEDISGTVCPLDAVKLYAPKHNANVFFDDMTGKRSPTDAHCISHNRPLSELSGDLSGNKVARFNFITPNLCHDMHNTCAPQNDSVRQGDDWLAQTVPAILASKAFTDGGLVLVTWDESENGDFPIGMIALSGKALPGHASMTKYSHSDALHTLQTIFAVTPLLGDAKNAADLSDLFSSFP